MNYQSDDGFPRDEPQLRQLHIALVLRKSPPPS